MVGGASHVVNHYILKKGALRAVVLYWYQGRGRIVANEYAVKWNLLRDAALPDIPKRRSFASSFLFQNPRLQPLPIPWCFARPIR